MNQLIIYQFTPQYTKNDWYLERLITGDHFKFKYMAEIVTCFLLRVQ